MKRIVRIAVRDFIAVAMTKGFIIGLLIFPAILIVSGTLLPRLFMDSAFQVEGSYAIIDPTGAVQPELSLALDPDAIAERRLEERRRLLEQLPDMVRDVAQGDTERQLLDEPGPVPNVRLVALPADADVEAEKAWLDGATDGFRHTALIVIHDNAVATQSTEQRFGSYDLYVVPNLDDRDLGFIHNTVREAIVTARVARQSLDRDAIEAVLEVSRPGATTVSPDGEQRALPGFNAMLPLAFMLLLFMGIMTGGGTMLTSTIEEKSSRVVEVLLSAVSPMELMAGKLLGGVAISLVTMGLYIGLGLVALASFSLFGMLDPWLIFYLVIFFLIGFFVIGSLMLAIGGAVNELSEAQQLQMPLMLIVMAPWLLWPVISRDPNSTLAIVASFLPPINPFGMLLRMASTQPPPLWQVWLSIGVCAASVVGAVWVAAKVFRIGLLMHGKPPNLKTLLRWVRMA